MNDNGKYTVLHLITRLDPGGSAENTVLSAELVDPKRFNSIVLTGPGLERKEPPPDFSRRLGKRLKVEPSLLRPIRPHTDFVAIYRIIHWLKTYKPDILHLHSAKAGAVGRVAAKLSGINPKVIYTPHGHVFSGYGGRSVSELFTMVEKSLARHCHAIVGLTADEIRAFTAVGAGKPQQYCVIPSGVPVDSIRPASEHRDEVRDELGIDPDIPVVGFVGRLTSVKGPDVFVNTARAITKTLPNVHFLVVGDGDMLPGLQRMVVDSQLEKSFTWTGWRKDAMKLMSAFDLLLLTSRNEGQGRVLVEAMASELPTVAMLTGGVGEVIDTGVTGLVVPGNDVDHAAEAVISLLEHRQKRMQMGKEGRKQAFEKFSVQVMIDRLERLYTGLLQDRTPAEIFK